MAATLGTYLTALALTVSSGLAAASAAFAWHAFFGALEAPVSSSHRPAAPSFRLASLHHHDELAIAASELATRPLFSPLRQKPVPRVVAAPPPPPPVQRPAPPPPPDYAIGGLVIAASVRKVLLRAPGRAGGKWLKEGEVTAEGWSVNKIESGNVVLAQGDRTIRFALSTGGGKGERFVALKDFTMGGGQIR
jgi:hypothetical protein